jgi:hypothetical protein
MTGMLIIIKNIYTVTRGVVFILVFLKPFLGIMPELVFIGGVGLYLVFFILHTKKIVDDFLRSNNLYFYEFVIMVCFCVPFGIFLSFLFESNPQVKVPESLFDDFFMPASQYSWDFGSGYNPENPRCSSVRSPSEKFNYFLSQQEKKDLTEEVRVLATSAAEASMQYKNLPLLSENEILRVLEHKGKDGNCLVFKVILAAVENRPGQLSVASFYQSVNPLYCNPVYLAVQFKDQSNLEFLAWWASELADFRIKNQANDYIDFDSNFIKFYLQLCWEIRGFEDDNLLNLIKTLDQNYLSLSYKDRFYIKLSNYTRVFK